MKRYFLVGSLFLLLCCVAPSGVSQEIPPKLNLEFKLLNPAILGLDSTASARPFGSSGLGFTFGSPNATQITLEIVTKPVAINSLAKLDEFLGENGILPDNNAHSFVYYLNPDLASVREIATATTLELPILQIPKITNERKLPRQPIIALVVEPMLKNNLRQDVDNFRLTVKKKKKTFVPPVVEGLNSINLNLEEFYEDRVPSSREMLEQVKADVATLDSILAKYPRKAGSIFSKRPKLFLNTEDSQLFALIKADLLDKVEASKKGNPDVPVNVRTLREGGEISNFIVCYAPEARYKANQCELSFPEQSSPTEYPLPVATYMFWAAKPGDASAVSDIRRIPVRWQDGQAMHIDLSILK